MSKNKKRGAGSSKKLWVRVLCIALGVLMAGSAVASVLYMLLQ